MTSVLRQMDPDVAAKDMLESLGLPDRGPLHRMDKAAVIAQANAQIVADGGIPLSPLAAGSFGQAMAYLSSQTAADEDDDDGGGESENVLQLGDEVLELGGEELTLGEE